MKINAEFSQIASAHTAEQDWIPSPVIGVDRKPLDRVGNEVARATSIVRYAPQSTFSPHTHSGGEEFIVLEGVFQDEHGDYPVGSYVRNPPQSRHKPGSEKGCVIFVKLWQFQPEDRKHVNILMENAEISFANNLDKVVERLLYADERERVKHVTLSANTDWQSDAENGNEILILDGTVIHDKEILEKQDWLRIPDGKELHLRAGSEGAKIWLKTGNLPDIENQLKRLKSG